MTACAAPRFMAKSIDPTLGAQMRIGTRLKIIFLVMCWGLVIKIVVGHASRCWVAWAALWAATAGALGAGCAAMRCTCAMRGLTRIRAARRALGAS